MTLRRSLISVCSAVAFLFWRSAVNAGMVLAAPSHVFVPYSMYNADSVLLPNYKPCTLNPLARIQGSRGTADHTYDIL